MPETLPAVSVVIPNWNGKRHLERCFASLEALAYGGRVELILVDNGSRDGSLALMRRRHPRVRLIQNRVNEGFAAACNRGARAAEGAVVAFLNNDMRVEPEWLSGLVFALRGGARCAASLIMSWDGSRVNFAGGGMNFHGIGIQLGLGDEDAARYHEPGDTLFACGGAMAVERRLFLDAGGFDEEFFAFYEDVDFGWRLWVLGEKVVYAPASIAYHHHSATAARVDLHRLRLLQIRNPLCAIFKNYSAENLAKALPAALLLTLRRTRYLLALDPAEFSLGGNRGMERGLLAGLRVRARAKLKKARVARAGLADVLAIDDFVDRLPRLAEKRRWIQERRRRPDGEILPLFRDPRWLAESSPDYAEAQDVLLRFFGLDEVLGPPGR